MNGHRRRRGLAGAAHPYLAGADPHDAERKPPIAVIVPGRTIPLRQSMRHHTPMFHQVEGLVIDKTSNMAQLKGCLLEFCRTFFRAPDLTLQFRPSYFPFTEPLGRGGYSLRPLGR